MALPINIKDLLNNRIPFHPDFMGDVLVDVQVNVQVELADIESVIRKMSESCPSYVLVLPQRDIEKLAICLLRCSTEISGRNMLDGIDSTSYKQRKRRYYLSDSNSLYGLS